MKPNFLIRAKDNPILTDRVISLSLTDKIEDISDSLRVIFDDRDGAIEIPRQGVELTVSLGYSQLFEFGTFFSDDVTIEDGTLTVLATGFDKNSNLKTIRHKTHEGSLRSIVEGIAKANSLEVSIDSRIQNTPKTIIQRNESDLHFLTRICKDHGAFFKIEGKRLLVGRKGVASSAEIIITPKVVRSYNASFNYRDSFKTVEALFDDDGEEKLVSMGSDDPIKRLTKIFKSRDEALNAAQVALEEAKNKSIKFSFSCPGNPLIRAGLGFKARDFKPGFDGVYLVDEVTHTIDQSGFLTSATGFLSL